MTCQKCGNELDSTSKFCGSCGMPISQQPPEQPIGSVPQQQPTEANNQVNQPMPPTPESTYQQSSSTTQSSQNHIGAAYQQASTMPNTPPKASQVATANYNTGTATAVPAPVAHSNNSGKSVSSLVVGILAIFGSLIPIVGFIMGIIAVILGSISLKSSKRGMSISGLVIGIIAIVLSLIMFVISYSAIVNESQSYGSDYSSKVYTNTSSNVKSDNLLDASIGIEISPEAVKNATY